MDKFESAVRAIGKVPVRTGDEKAAVEEIGMIVRATLAPEPITPSTTVTPAARACVFCTVMYGHRENCPMVPAGPYRTEG